MSNKISQTVYPLISKPVEAAGVAVSKSEGLEKTFKFIISIIDGLQTIVSKYGDVSTLAVAIVLKGQLKIVADTISGLGFISRLTEWVCPESGKNVPFWLAATSSVKEKWILRMKIASKIPLTVAGFIEFIKLGDSLGLYKLGIASNMIGNVPVLGLVKDTAIVASSAFSIAGNAISLTKTAPELARARRRCNEWKEIGESLRHGESTSKEQVDKKGALKTILEDQLAKKCAGKALLHDAELKKEMEKAAKALGVDQKLIEDLFEAKHAVAFSEETSGLEGAVADAQEELKKGVPAGRESEIENALKKCQIHFDKQVKWHKLTANETYLNGTRKIVLAGNSEERLQAYCQHKIARAKQRAEDHLQNKEKIRDALLRSFDDKAAEAERQVALVYPEKEVASAKEAVDALVALAESGRVSHFANHRFEVLKAEKTNAGRKVTKSLIAIANDVAKIAIIILASTVTALGLLSFGWAAAITALALTVNGLGLFKFFYEEMVAKKIASAPKLGEVLV